MRDNVESGDLRDRLDSATHHSLFQDAYSPQALSRGTFDKNRSTDAISQAFLPDASSLLKPPSVAQAADSAVRQHTAHDSHPHGQGHQTRHHPYGHNSEHHVGELDHAHHTRHHRDVHTSAHHPQHHGDAHGHNRHEQQKPHHSENLMQIREDIEEHIKEINKNFPNDPGARILLIAQELGKDPERWRSSGAGKCNVFVEAALKEAGVEFPWKEGNATAQGMMNALLKDKTHFDAAYKFHGETNMQFHDKYKPQHGDIIVWYKNGAEHIGIVEDTYDRLGNILTAGVRESGPKGHPTGYAHYALDWYTTSGNYGPPSYVFRSKH